MKAEVERQSRTLSYFGIFLFLCTFCVCAATFCVTFGISQDIAQIEQQLGTANVDTDVKHNDVSDDDSRDVKIGNEMAALLGDNRKFGRKARSTRGARSQRKRDRRSEFFDMSLKPDTSNVTGCCLFQIRAPTEESR